MRRKTHEEFVEEIKNINPNIEILGKYINTRTKILCKCKLDGYEWSTRPHDLLMGCGCHECKGKTIYKLRAKTHEQFVEELSLINPNVEVLGEYVNNRTKILCRCKLDGYEWSPVPNTLLAGCGCPQCIKKYKTTEDFIKHIENITTDIEVIGEYIDAKTPIECKCKVCQHIWFPFPNNLRISGCPMCKTSRGERDIKRFLSNNGITYKHQKKYKDLLGIGGGQLSYDFYLPDYNLLIEYQGEQHERPVDIFGGEKRFETQQENDKRKREYAQKNNIELLEIWYYDYNNIDDILTNRLLEQSI